MIKNKYTNEQVEFSCEVFPPRRNDEMYDIFQTLDDISTLKPDYISVTYGAGGSNSKKTAKIAAYIQHICEVESLAHMTAVGMNPESLESLLNELKTKGVKRILALRGDRPRTMSEEEYQNRYYKYASDIIPEIKKYGDFKLYAACYPEKHPESMDVESDIRYLKAKVDLGVDGLITQMFFDNEKLYRFMDQLDKSGITASLHAGIMPITRVNQLGTSVSLSGSSVPSSLSNLIAKYSDDPVGMKQAGIEFAVNQIDDLLKHGVKGIHLYSMNKADVTRDIYEAIVG